jgi:hypothetical protein
MACGLPGDALETAGALGRWANIILSCDSWKVLLQGTAPVAGRESDTAGHSCLPLSE